MSSGYLPATLFGAWEKCRWHRNFVGILRFSPFSIFQNSLIKRRDIKSKLHKFYMNKHNTKLFLLIN